MSGMGRGATAIMIALATAAVTGCASANRSAPGSPDLTPVGGSPASFRGKLYADCIAQAASTATYDRTVDSGTYLLRFTCSGAPARAFYVELGGWSAQERSEWVADHRTWRSTGKVIRNLFGVDYCSSDNASDYQCVVTLNVGKFLAE